MRTTLIQRVFFLLAIAPAVAASAQEDPPEWCWKNFSRVVSAESASGKSWTSELFCGLQKQFILGGATRGCEDFKRQLGKVDQHLLRAFEYLEAIPPDVMSGEKAPSFRMASAILYARQELAEGLRSLQQQKKLSWIPDLIPKVKEAFIERKTSDPWIPTDSRGRPLLGSATLDYRNRRDFERELILLDRMLPPALRLPIPHAAFKNIKGRLGKEATEMVARHKRIFEERYSSTGFRDHAEFLAAMKAASPRARALVELLDRAADPASKEVEVVIFSRPHTRESIATKGFVNFEVTGSTGGGGPEREYRDIRRHIEALKLGLSDEEYEKIDPLLRPIYGLIQALDGDKKKLLHEPPWYGNDAWIIKKSAKIQKRMTLHRNDSYRAGVSDKPVSSRSWGDFFIPWDFRQLMIPNVLGENAYFQDRLNVTTRWSPEEKEALKNKHFVESSIGLYPEVQFWGPIDPEDIEAFEFWWNSEPPSPELVRELDRRGIQLRVRTSHGAIPWRPGDDPQALR